MTLEELEAAVKPFADAADVFNHNIHGVPKVGEVLFHKHYTVQGQDRYAVITVAHILAAKAAYDFIQIVKGPSATDGAGFGDAAGGEVKKAGVARPATEADASDPNVQQPSAEAGE